MKNIFFTKIENFKGLLTIKIHFFEQHPLFFTLKIKIYEFLSIKAEFCRTF